MANNAWDFYKKSVASMNGQFNTQRDAITKRLQARGFRPSDSQWVSSMSKLDDMQMSESRILERSSLVRNLKRTANSLQTEATVDMQANLEKQLGRTALNWELKLEGV